MNCEESMMCAESLMKILRSICWQVFLTFSLSVIHFYHPLHIFFQIYAIPIMMSCVVWYSMAKLYAKSKSLSYNKDQDQDQDQDRSMITGIIGIFLNVYCVLTNKSKTTVIISMLITFWITCNIIIYNIIIYMMGKNQKIIKVLSSCCFVCLILINIISALQGICFLQAMGCSIGLIISTYLITRYIAQYLQSAQHFNNFNNFNNEDNDSMIKIHLSIMGIFVTFVRFLQ
jgi:hypothetical protein